MRAVTLAKPEIARKLNSHFACAWMNIEGKRSYAGSSNKHQPTDGAKMVGNCTGHHNVQTFMMSRDGRVLNMLPGFWSAELLSKQIDLAKKLDGIWRSKSLSTYDKYERFMNEHLTMSVALAKAAKESQLPFFDQAKLARERNEDFVRTAGGKANTLKTPDQVLHERMAERPFLPLDKFDTATVIAMGQKRFKYDDGMKSKEKDSKRKLRSTSKRR